MELSRTIRKAVGRILGRQVLGRVRRYRQGNVPGLEVYRSQLADKRGLEIGGPSAILGDEGPLPVYAVLSSLDNCLYSAQTIWTGKVQDGNTFQYHPKKPVGHQIICEATDLR